MLWLSGALGVVLLAALLAAIRMRLTSRLEARVAEPRQASHRHSAVGVAVSVVTIPAAMVTLVVAQWFGVVPGIVGVIGVGAGIGVGPPLIIAGLVARRAERASDHVVTWRDVRLGTLGRSATIPPDVATVVHNPGATPGGANDLREGPA